MITYPLTQPQLGLFLECMQHPEITRYNQPFLVELPKTVDLDRVEQALKTIYDSRHELRIRFLMEDGTPRQFADDPGLLTVERLKLSEEASQQYIKDFVTPFDIFKDTLVRFTLIETPERNLLLSQLHHLVADGMTMAMNLSKIDFPLAYNSQPLADIPYGMLQLAEDEEATYQTPDYQRAKEYYRQEYSGYRMISLSSNGLDTMGESISCSELIPMAEVDTWCKELGIQSNLLFMAAFSQVIATLSREEKIAYTTLSHGRMDRRLRKSYGMFVHTVPVKADVNQQQTVIDFIRSFRRELMSTIRYAIYPFNHFCRDLQMVPGINFSFQSSSITEVLDFGDEQYPITHLPKGKTTGDMTVIIYEVDNQYDIRLEASDKLYTSEYLKMVARCIKNCVVAMMQQPDGQLSAINMLDNEEQKTLIELGTGIRLDTSAAQTWVEAFEQRAAQQPDRVAVVDSNSQLTYKQLSQQSDVLAQRLIEAGVQPNDFVCVMLPRQKEFPLAILGIHKAGAAYAPLDTDYPADRLNYMMDNSQAKVLLTMRQTLADKKAADGFEAGKAHIIYIDDIDFTTHCEHVNRTAPGNLAYMIYTSGSTGKPKGVMLQQAGLWNFTVSTIRINSLNADDRISCHRSFSFDAHIEDIFPVLTAGASVHIMPSEIRKDLGEIYRFLSEHQITGGGYTTSIAKMLLTSFNLTQRYITCGGEALSGVVSDKVQIINVYGPTECTDHSAIYPMKRGREYKNIPIGRPMPNCYCLILDSQGRLLPRGVEGELCVAGPQVGCGYWQLPEQTQKAFFTLPEQLGSLGLTGRAYRTGDICRWNDEGLLEYVGRADSQVKLRGYRIEVGEIEDALLRFPDIERAAAEIKTIGGTQHLCAYYTANRPVNENELRNFLSQVLTSYMVPDAYMQLDELPRTPNGKVDRRRLPEPTIVYKLENVEPKTDKERTLLTIARQLLNRDDFGVTDDLVLLGLTSMTAMKLAVLSGKQGVLLKVADVVKMRTIQKILSVNMGLGFWYNGYDRNKPIVVLLHGVVDSNAIMSKAKLWQEHFSVFVFEPTFEHFKYVFTDANGVEMIELYYTYLKMKMPAGANIHAFIGMSWGGEQAYWLACRWSHETGTHPIAYISDTRLNQEDAEIDEATYIRFANYVKTLSPQQAEIPTEQLAQLLKEKYDMIKHLKMPDFPHYDGPLVLFCAKKDHPDVEEYISRWTTLAPRTRPVIVEDNHAYLCNTSKYDNLYLQQMLKDLQQR